MKAFFAQSKCQFGGGRNCVLFIRFVFGGGSEREKMLGKPTARLGSLKRESSE
jgi:hypothetical protein